MSTEMITLVATALQEVIQQKDLRLSAPVDGDTPIFGRNGLLDSLGLVSLVVALEQAIEDQFGTSISLADEKALSQKSSPYKTVGALAEYASRLIEEGPPRG